MNLAPLTTDNFQKFYKNTNFLSIMYKRLQKSYRYTYIAAVIYKPRQITAFRGIYNIFQINSKQVRTTNTSCLIFLFSEICYARSYHLANVFNNLKTNEM